jgi:DNA-binding NarL/FixJ family response regulator
MTSGTEVQVHEELSDVTTPARAVRVFIDAADPLSHAGLLGQLRLRPEVEIVTDVVATADVVVATSDNPNDDLFRRRLAQYLRQGLHVVLVVAAIDPSALVGVIDVGVRSVVRRANATSDCLVRALQNAVQGQAEVPHEVLHHLSTQATPSSGRARARRTSNRITPTPREQQILQLVAEGYTTAEIAVRMCYSERTVKNCLQELTTRLNLRNRSQAVAHAIKNGWI